MKNIYYVHEWINLICNKLQIDFFPPAQIDTAVNLAQNLIFENLYRMYESSQEISDSLIPFLVNDFALTLTNGEGNKPSEYIHKASITANGYPVDVLEQMFKGYKEHDPICPPTADFPICYVLPTKLKFVPSTVTNVKLSYLKVPTIPYYAFTVADDEIVYNDSLSVALDWNIIDCTQIALRACGILGITIRELDLTQILPTFNTEPTNKV